MNTKNLLKRFISQGAVIYTAGTLLLLLSTLMLPEGASQKMLAVKPFLFFAIFSYCMSFGNMLRASENIQSYIGSLLHAVCYILGFFMFVMLCGMKFSVSIIFAAVFAACYALTIFIIAMIKKPSKKNKRPVQKPDNHRARPQKNKKPDNDTYQNRFS